ncbi:hypothetical protein Z962_03910 [Clostridium botulinum C/D str. BKT12695]|nr:hypothetical protein Z962_03910 [Clostridium botulinum C/D str. BKT12695]
MGESPTRSRRCKREVFLHETTDILIYWEGWKSDDTQVRRPAYFCTPMNSTDDRGCFNEILYTFFDLLTFIGRGFLFLEKT